LALAGAAASASSPAVAAQANDAKFRSRWNDESDRIWLGADYWAAPLQDWCVVDGAAECVNAAPNRVVHLLTADLADRKGGFTTSVKIRRTDAAKFGDGKGSAGFRVGIRGPLGDYRNALLYGKGLDAGLTASVACCKSLSPNGGIWAVSFNVPRDSVYCVNRIGPNARSG